MTPSTWALRMQAPFSFGMSRGRICHRCPPTRSSCSARMAQRLGNLGACVRSGNSTSLSSMRGRISIRHDQVDRDLIPIAEMEGLAEEVTGDDLHDVHMP